MAIIVKRTMPEGRAYLLIGELHAQGRISSVERDVLESAIRPHLPTTLDVDPAQRDRSNPNLSIVVGDATGD